VFDLTGSTSGRSTKGCGCCFRRTLLGGEADALLRETDSAYRD